MKVYFILIILIFKVYTSVSQNTIKGRTFDKETRLPLSYVNIMIENNYIGTSSNEKGLFKLQLNDSLKNSNIIFSNIGYKTIKLPVHYFNDSVKKMFLVKNAIKLDEVIINNKRKNKELILNKFKKKKCNLLYSTEPFLKGKSVWIPYRKEEPTIEGIFFPNKKSNKNLYLKEIDILMKSFSEDALFRIHLFNVDKKGLPYKSIIKLPIQHIAKGTHLIKLDLKKYDMEMPRIGLFIGVELLMIEQNITTIKNYENEESKIISPFLFYTPTPLDKNKEYEFLRYTKGAWDKITIYQQNFINTNKKSKKVYKPAITLILE